MNGQKNIERSDEHVYRAFTRYVQLSLEGARKNYISKLIRDKAMSLDVLVEREDPSLASESEELELILDNMETLEEVICNDAMLVAILRLSDRERRIMNLHLVHKMKFREIADLLGLTTNTVGQCYTRLLKKLREYLRGDNHEEF